MADSEHDGPATRADLTRLARSLNQAGAADRAEQAARLDAARADLAAETARTRQLLRADLAQIRQDLVERLDTACASLDALFDERDTRLVLIVLATQLAALAMVAGAYHLLG